MQTDCKPADQAGCFVTVELSNASTFLPTGFTTTSSAVNRIPHVIDAPPGYVTLERLPKLTYRSQLSF